MSYDFDLKAIEDHTGLKENFIRRIIKDLPEIVDAYGEKQAHNKIFFDSNGLQAFIAAGGLKQKGSTLPQILEAIKQGLPTAQKQANSATELQPKETPFSRESFLLDLVKTAQQQAKEAYQTALQAKDSELQAQRQRIVELEQRLLTEPAAAIQSRKEQEELAAAAATKQAEAQTELERKLKLAEEERQEIEKREKEQAEKARDALELQRSKAEQALKDSLAAKAWAAWEGKRAALLQELQELSWFAGKRKSEIKKALAELEQEKPESYTGISTEVGK